MNDIIKKGTRIECLQALTEKEGPKDVSLEKGEYFYQEEDNTTPVYQGHQYGIGWHPYMKIVKPINIEEIIKIL